MKRWIVIGLALGAVGAAYGQHTGDGPERERAMRESARGFGFRLGVYLPIDNDVRDAEPTLLDFAIEYEFERSLFGGGGDTFLALDFVSSGSVDLWAVTLNQRIYTGTSLFSDSGRSYFYGGVGILNLDAGGSDGSALALRGGIGSEFNVNTFAEAGLFIGGDRSGVNPSGIQVSLGYRFR